MEKVKLSKKGLQNDIEVSGLTRVQLAEKYGISTAQIKKALEMTGLTELRAKQVAFEIVEEEIEETPVKTPIVEVPEIKETPAVKAPVEPPTAPFSGIVVENEEEN
jgi:hypothetical protein